MNTRTTAGLLATTLLFAGVGCGPEDDDETYEVSSSELAGTINGESFAYKSGFASDMFGDGEYWIELHSEEVEDPCDTFAYGSGPHLIVSTEPEPKDINLGLSNNVTFAYQADDVSENDIGTTGRLIIDQADDQKVKGALYAVFDNDDGKSHKVDGQFEVPFCPEEE